MSTAPGAAEELAESAAGGEAALTVPPPPHSGTGTASKGSNGEVCSANARSSPRSSQRVGCTSDGTLSTEQGLSQGGDVEPEELPSGLVRVPVVVGMLKAWYIVQKSKVVYGGKEITPTQFEVLGGRMTARKWRISIRVLLPDGTAGKALGRWLLDHRFEQSTVPIKRKRSELPSALADGPMDPPTTEVSPCKPAVPRGRLQKQKQREPQQPQQQERRAQQAQEPQPQWQPQPQQQPLSPTKSLRSESLPGSPACCPYCKQCGGIGGGAAAAVAAKVPVSLGPTLQPPGCASQQCSPTRRRRRQRSPTPNPEAIRRSLEAFLASLPPSAQAALGAAVGFEPPRSASPSYPTQPAPLQPTQQQRLQEPLQRQQWQQQRPLQQAFSHPEQALTQLAQPFSQPAQAYMQPAQPSSQAEQAYMQPAQAVSQPAQAFTQPAAAPRTGMLPPLSTLRSNMSWRPSAPQPALAPRLAQQQQWQDGAASLAVHSDAAHFPGDYAAPALPAPIGHTRLAPLPQLPPVGSRPYQARATAAGRTAIHPAACNPMLAARPLAQPPTASAQQAGGYSQLLGLGSYSAAGPAVGGPRAAAASSEPAPQPSVPMSWGPGQAAPLAGRAPGLGQQQGQAQQGGSGEDADLDWLMEGAEELDLTGLLGQATPRGQRQQQQQPLHGEAPVQPEQPQWVQQAGQCAAQAPLQQQQQPWPGVLPSAAQQQAAEQLREEVSGSGLATGGSGVAEVTPLHTLDVELDGAMTSSQQQQPLQPGAGTGIGRSIHELSPIDVLLGGTPGGAGGRGNSGAESSPSGSEAEEWPQVEGDQLALLAGLLRSEPPTPMEGMAAAAAAVGPPQPAAPLQPPAAAACRPLQPQQLQQQQQEEEEAGPEAESLWPSDDELEAVLGTNALAPSALPPAPPLALGHEPAAACAEPKLGDARLPGSAINLKVFAGMAPAPPLAGQPADLAVQGGGLPADAGSVEFWFTSP